MKINAYFLYTQGIKKTISISSFAKGYIIKPLNEKISTDDLTENVINIEDNLFSTSSLKRIFSEDNDSEYTVLASKPGYYQFSEDFINNINSSNIISYSDYQIKGKGEIKCIDYQNGSIRDNFDFGPILIFKTKESKIILDNVSDFHFAGLYSLILKSKSITLPFHINKCLYTIDTNIIDNRKSGERQFDYLDPKKRDVQIEFEKAATEHLKEIGAFIDYNNLKSIDFSHKFKYKASVVIPVFNRVKTVADAIKSAASQKLDYPYNVIVVDNHSTDGTTEIIKELAKLDNKIFHIIPEENDLKIGGCWNKALLNENCGEFAIQLDSDDIYSSENTLQEIVNKFIEEKCAMVIGSYRITNFSLETLPPGVIDHKEWTNENGMNNALRINGLGAPRAFYTPVARQILFPNCSYGEDYAMGLAISRQFKLGRIYNILYICRRWEGNSDANLSKEKENQNNFNKDVMRTSEIEKRILLNSISK